MAVLAFRMAFLIIHVAATSSTGVSRTLGKNQNKSDQIFLVTFYNFDIIIIKIKSNHLGGALRKNNVMRLSYPGTPARSSGYPADLSVTDSAAQPITSIPFLHNDATLGTVHSLP